MDNNLPKVHVVQRWLSNANMSDPNNPGIVSGPDLDAILSSWVEKGYVIDKVTYLGSTVEGHGFNYVLVRVP